jgi:hypothetical protein
MPFLVLKKIWIKVMCDISNTTLVLMAQPDDSANDSETITKTVADPLTDKACRESGICTT